MSDTYTRAQLDAAVAEEREACARVAENSEFRHAGDKARAGQFIGEAIRARGPKASEAKVDCCHICGTVDDTHDPHCSAVDKPTAASSSQASSATETRSDASPFAGHTPGPWFISENYRRERGVDAVLVSSKTDNGLPGIAKVFTAPGPQCEANARLIAAAPSLLAEVARLTEAIKRQKGALKMFKAANKRVAMARVPAEIKEAAEAARRNEAGVQEANAVLTDEVERLTERNAGLAMALRTIRALTWPPGCAGHVADMDALIDNTLAKFGGGGS